MAQANFEQEGIRALITGHSYVYSFEKYLQDLDRKTNSNLHSSKFCPNHLKVSNKIGSVFFSGQRGAHICPGSDKPYILPISLVNAIKPQVVVLDIGTNDIVSWFNPLHVATSIIHVAEHMRDNLGVRDIRICSVLSRVAMRDMVKEDFLCRAYEVNGHLRELCLSAPCIFYHLHEGFWQTEDHQVLSVDSWSWDGIHPNLKSGRDKYVKCMRSALHNAAREIRIN